MKTEGIRVQELIEAAMHTLCNAYAPYSGFKVASALLAADGRIFTGCNVENAAYSPGVCAERTAFVKAVSEGVKEFTAICIVNEDQNGAHGYCPPCGVCRQTMMEFCRPETFYIILAADKEHYEIHTLEELFPMGFGPGSL